VGPTEAQDGAGHAAAEASGASFLAGAQDFAKSMVSTAAGAIPLYYGILKYLGLGSAGMVGRRLSIAAPLAFLAASVAFALAARPQWQPPARQRAAHDGMPTADTVRSVDRTIRIGTALFVLGLLIGSARLALAAAA